jgi:steroid delta-isomerase-like uncharacterized protein
VDTWSDDDREGHRSHFAGDAVLYEHGTGREVAGADAIVDLHWGWRVSFPDGRGEIATVVDGGDQVVVEVVWTGTHGGPLQTPDGATVPPTGRTFAVPAAMVLTMRDGRITRMTHYFNLLTLIGQLGV